MAQFGRPSSDITTDWTTTPLWSKLDEVSPDDGDFITGTGTAKTFEVALSSVTDPQSSTGHVVRIRAKATGSGAAERLNTWGLYQGVTAIATQNASITRDSFNEYSITLSGAQADAITDYTDLRIRGLTSQGASETIDVSWVEFECPDATVTTDKTQTALARITAQATQTQTALARITAQTLKTQTALARITAQTTQTQTAKANIAAVTQTSQTQTALARITAQVSESQTALARIRDTVDQTQTARARITVQVSPSQSALGRITVTADETQPATARITNTVDQTITAKANIAGASTVDQTQTALARITVTVDEGQTAVARVTAQGSQAQTAVARISATVGQTQTAIARITDTQDKTQTALARVLESIPGEPEGGGPGEGAPCAGVTLRAAGGLGDQLDATYGEATFTNSGGAPVSDTLVVELQLLLHSLQSMVSAVISIRALLIDDSGAATAATIYLTEPDVALPIATPGAAFADISADPVTNLTYIQANTEVHVDYTIDPGETITLRVSEFFACVTLVERQVEVVGTHGPIAVEAKHGDVEAAGQHGPVSVSGEMLGGQP
jgi:hypothetical protein